ncbi:MAG: tRNA (guanosine(46)-N7)-methyltransferase TrmB [bacterium]
MGSFEKLLKAILYKYFDAMPRTKHKKIAEVRTLINVFDSRKEHKEDDIRKYFGNDSSISIEIGCGHGDYTLNMAAAYPGRNFIGIDMKGARIWAGSKKALSMNLKNVAFLLCNVEYMREAFPKEKIEEIYLPFPDPHVRRTSAQHRLVSPKFVELYKSIIALDGKVHFKTDNDGLFEYATKILAEETAVIEKSTNDLYASDNLSFVETIKTKYEQHYLAEGRKIKYIRFGFK